MKRSEKGMVFAHPSCGRVTMNEAVAIGNPCNDDEEKWNDIIMLMMKISCWIGQVSVTRM